LLGATVLRADGEFVKAGGRVVKNVTGYDMLRLWCGSLGTLGMFTQVALRVYPIVETVDLAFERPTAQRAVELCDRIYRADLRAEALEASNDGDHWQVFARVPAPAAALAAEMGGFVGTGEGRYDSLSTLGWRDGDAATLYARCQPASVADVAGLLSEYGGTVTARPVTGTVIGTWQDTPGLGASLPAIVNRVRDDLSRTGGSVIVERMPDSLRTVVDTWGDPPGTLAVMKRIKRAYDPAGRLNRGRYLGGI
jgi:glycolate oxidase FAD binding subunit